MKLRPAFKGLPIAEMVLAQWKVTKQNPVPQGLWTRNRIHLSL